MAENLEKISYEDTYNELVNILGKLENESPGLDESLELYQRGIELYRKCNALLEEAQLKITKISADGEVDFDIETEDSSAKDGESIE